MLATQPRHPKALVMLGGILGQSQRVKEAIAILTVAAEVAGRDPDAKYFLGMAYLADQQTEKAAEVLRVVVKKWPKHPFALGNLGVALSILGQFDAAIRALEKARKINPNHPDNYFNLALCLQNAGRQSRAITVCEEILKKAPGNARALMLRGKSEARLGRIEAAAQSLGTAFQGAPGNSECVIAWATFLSDQGRLSEALQVCDHGMVLPGQAPKFLYAKGRFLREAGAFDEAVTALRECLKSNPQHFGAIYTLSLLKALAPQDRELEALREAQALTKPRSVERSQIAYVLGAALERHGRHDEAFAAYKEANDCLRRIHEPDLAGYQKRFERLRKRFPAKTKSAVAVPVGQAQPIFIVGMPRSGTTLVEQMLSSHPAVAAGGELTLLRTLLRDRMDAFPDGLSNLSPRILAEVADAYREGVGQFLGQDLSGPVTRFTDKMPSNYELVGLIEEAFPDAKIIHCRRDPLDTCFSCYTVNFADRQFFTTKLDELAEAYNHYHQAMAHWRQVLEPGRIFDLDYESLVRDPEPQLRALLAHCELEWDPACLRFHENKSQIRTASALQARQPLYQSSLARAKRFEAHLAPLIEALPS